MKHTALLSILLVAAAGMVAASTAKAKPRAPADSFDRSASDRTTVKTSFVSFPVSHGGKTWYTAAALREPLGPDGQPVVAPHGAAVIVHGSGGVDSRGDTYAQALNRAGFTTLEIDLWAVRGVTTPAERPKAVAETLPDAFAALDFLSHRSGVDPQRIGIMGFSWGGVVSMLSATAANRDAFAKPGQSFAAHAPLYPVCWVYNHVPGYEFKALTGAPVLVQSGAADAYDAPDSCAKLHEALPDEARGRVRVVNYPGATHAWDRRETDTVVQDPTSHQGKGGAVPFTYNREVTRRSVAAVVGFFGETLAAKG
jgi:dienelactone hydrolase